jgi:crotonobetainyl-CoA:carnitine CoA-transferase CaiB-like acyl-CoA transferase
MNHNRIRYVPEFPRGVVVAEYGDGLAGAAATATLAALGADVTTVSDSDSLLRRRLPALTLDGHSVSVLSAVLDADKNVSSSSAPASPMVTVVDRCEGSGPLSDMPVDEYLDQVHAVNRAVWVTLSPCGLTGPRRRSRFNEFLAAAHADIEGAGPEDASNHLVPFTPHGVFATAVERQWIALAVCNDEQWRGLCATLGDPAPLTDQLFATAESRKADEAQLDAALQDAVVGADAVNLVSALQDAGVAAAHVMAPEDIVVDRHLRSRGFFRPVAHPQWGTRRLVGVPWRIVGRPAFTLGAPPLLDLQPTED